jgi:hypothetical protein
MLMLCDVNGIKNSLSLKMFFFSNANGIRASDDMNVKFLLNFSAIATDSPRAAVKIADLLLSSSFKQMKNLFTLFQVRERDREKQFMAIFI